MAELFRGGLRLGPRRSDQVRGGVRQIHFARGIKKSAAESAADSADLRGTNLFRRGSDRIRRGLAELPPRKTTKKVRASPPQGKSAADFCRISSSRNYSAADTAPRTYSANFELPRTYSANFELPRTYSANAPII